MPVALGPLQIDLVTGRVQGPAGPHVLSTLERRLLRHLWEADGRVVPREELLVQVWEASAAMQTRAVDIAVARLRARLERDPGAPEFLLSERGVGYRLVRQQEPAAPQPTVPPPTDSPILGRDAELAAILAALPRGPVVLRGLPGIGTTTLAQAVAARAQRDVAWIDLHHEDEPLGRIAAGFGVADEAAARARYRDWPGLVVFDHVAQLPLPPRPWCLVIGDVPGHRVPVGPLLPDAAEAVLRGACPRVLGPDEASAVAALVDRAGGVPATLVALARELRWQRADLVLERVGVGVEPAAWITARQRLSPAAQEVLRVAGSFGGDLPYGALARVASEATIDELEAAGWLRSAWSAEGEVRLQVVGGERLPPGPEVGAWLASLGEAALMREVRLALRYVAVAEDPHRDDVLRALHRVVWRRGGWAVYGAALERVAEPDPALRLARGHARWLRGEPAFDELDRAVHDATGPLRAEALCIRAFVRLRSFDVEGAAVDVAAIEPLSPRYVVQRAHLELLLAREGGVVEPRHLDSLRAALVVAERAGDPALVALARWYLGFGMMDAGDPEAEAVLVRCVEANRRLGLEVAALCAEAALVWVCFDRGELAAAERLLTEGLVRLADAALPRQAAEARRDRAVLHVLRGELDPARERLHALLGAPVGEASVRAVLAYVEARLGDAVEARRHAAIVQAAPDRGEGRLAAEAWLAAAGLAPAPDPRWAAVLIEPRVCARLPTLMPGSS